MKQFFIDKYNFHLEKVFHPLLTVSLNPLININFNLLICYINKQQREIIGNDFVDVTLSEVFINRDANFFYDLLMRGLGHEFDKPHDYFDSPKFGLNKPQKKNQLNNE